MVTLRRGDRLGDMVALQRLSSQLWPIGGHHPGGLGWALAIDELHEELQVAVESDDIVGWAGRTGESIEIQVNPDHPDAALPLLDWALDGVANVASLPIFDGDEVVRQLASSTGFEPDRTLPPVYGMFYDATSVRPSVPRGYRIRGLETGEEHARVEAHRAAWCPATLPFPPDVLKTIDPGLTSKFTDEKFEAVQRAWLYDPSLDLVVEGPDGTFVGCCTVWWDPSIGIAEIEPLGVHPQHRRRGLASAMCTHAAALIEARGGREIFINTGPNEDYPAPAVTYSAAGFSTVARATVWTRRRH